ncbi:G-type lectin S-receptor-like serine/threonine-protein kinase At4g27290 isoform X1 [Olea europaea var. sylvestris]|uniref:G-type lectin S-receptor-like serine/threonine-protein kinase At4g27290 isoform X1 n=4 Tax=Olea europaea var. sylvestris TaxID=158386 RepID=UPI000C1D1542|nr:G-type lectin S-receptor-like serine/threonine-protein kinase At4g27290 isoform X1 [Olea europaea var. sylvestris]
MKISNKYSLLIFVLTFLMSIQKISNQTDTITTTKILRDGKTIVSSGGIFELGFFSPGNSKNRYVGMWYKNITDKKVVWVANREIPVSNTSGVVLKVIEPGLLVLLNESNGRIIWSSNTSRPVKTPVAVLLDSGNLVVKDANDDGQGNFLWESFNNPTNTLLPGMKLGWNFITGMEVYLSSWNNNDDPSSGDFTYHLDPSGYPQLVMKSGSDVVFKTGPWNGLGYSGMPNLRNNSIFNFGVVINKNEAYHAFELLGSIISRYAVNPSGVAERWTWISRTQRWEVYITAPTDTCDRYKVCGAYGSCNIDNSPVCGCLDRFLPKDPEGWDRADWSAGCDRRTSLNCQNGDVFLKYSGIKLPDTQYSWFNKSMTLDECKVVCLKNCSCMAYSQLDISKGGSGCLLWFKDLIDIRQLSEAGQDIYIRMASSELQLNGRNKKVLELSLSLSIGMILLGLSLMLYLRRRKKRNHRLRSCGRQGHNKDIEIPMFDLYTISKATNNFSVNNKLGEGGFGHVYKGLFEEGQEIAVKRLSRNSFQGLDEFKSEVICIAKHQHRNLVKLLGCCIEGEEKMLIYEYMPNRSLDLILFDPMQSAVLDWPKRFHIINGIAQGLMYLHQDSRLRIIHRDLKASNILLDSDMNPKISDFGLARCFGGNETGANTSRVVGTYGYMSPEYAIDGHFSVKSDVYSFGVLVLEIVSGKRNRGFSHRDHHHNLLGHAWRLYKEGRSLELVNAHLDVSGYLSEVLRSIHVGLLCVQQCPQDRPSMSVAVSMLANEGLLPQARHPGFFTERDAESSSSTTTANSKNQMTISLVEAR